MRDGTGIARDPPQQRVAVIQVKQLGDGVPLLRDEPVDAASDRQVQRVARIEQPQVRRADRGTHGVGDARPPDACRRVTSRRPPAASLRSPSSRNASSPWVAQRAVVSSLSCGMRRTAVRRHWSAAAAMSSPESTASPAMCRASSRPSDTFTSSWATESASGSVRTEWSRPSLASQIGYQSPDAIRSMRPCRCATAPGPGRCTARSPAPEPADRDQAHARQVRRKQRGQPRVERRRPFKAGRRRRCVSEACPVSRRTAAGAAPTAH
jgi:hypothetical protein